MKRINAIIIDLDGVFFDSRELYKKIKEVTSSKDEEIRRYGLYLEELKSNSWCLELICNMIKSHKILFVTARSADKFDVTEGTIAKELIDYASTYHPDLTLHQMNNYDIFMRRPDDFKSDTEYKRGALKDLIRFYNIIFALDDNPEISKMYHEEGIPSLNVLGI